MNLAEKISAGIGQDTTYPARTYYGHSAGTVDMRLVIGRQTPVELPYIEYKYQQDNRQSTSDNIPNATLFRNDERTLDAPAYDNDILQLESIFQGILEGKVAAKVFSDTLRGIAWQTKSETAFERAIRIAVAIDAVNIAYSLAVLGSQKYPSNRALKRVVNIFAPPKVIERNRPPKPGLGDTMAWIQSHANEYRGRWVAVLNGQLIGSASSRNQLVETLGDNPAISDILITRIP